MDQLIYTYNAQGIRITNATSVCPDSPCIQCGENTTPAPPVVDASSTSPFIKDGLEDQEQKVGPPIKMREDGWVIALMVLVGLGIIMVVFMEIYLTSKIIGTPYVKHWRTMWLGKLLLLAVFLCYLTLFAFVPVPTKATCGILRFGVGVSFAMCFAIMLVKLMIILSSKSVGYLKGLFQLLMFFFAWGVQIVIDVQWLILEPPNVIKDDELGWVCEETFEANILSLVYVMFLILICTLIAIKTHGIITNHREGIFIGLVAGFTIPIWIAWVLLGMLNENKSFRDPAMAFGLFLTATLILFVMFLPKVRQLNSMGVEGIYAEDDAHDGYSPSVIQAPSFIPAPQMNHMGPPMTSLGPPPPPSVIGGSVIYGPPSYKSKPGSTVYVNGGVYSEPIVNRPNLHHQSDHSEYSEIN